MKYTLYIVLFFSSFLVNAQPQTYGKWKYNSPVVYKGQQFENFEFSGGLAKIVYNGKVGFIDSNRNIVIPLEYEDNAHISESYGALQVAYDFEHFGHTYKFVDGQAIVKKQGKYGVIDKEQNWRVPPLYFEVEKFLDIYYYVKRREQTATVEGPRHGFYDTTGKLVIPVEFLWVATPFPNKDSLETFAKRIAIRDTMENKLPINRKEAIAIAEKEGYYRQNQWVNIPRVEYDPKTNKWTIKSNVMTPTNDREWIEETMYIIYIDAKSGKVLDKKQETARHRRYE